MKEKFKSFNFWISLTSVLILFIRIIGDKFGVSIDENGFMDIMVLLCTVFVVLGIFDVPKTNIKTEDGENGITTISSSVAKIPKGSEIAVPILFVPISSANIRSNLSILPLLFL